MDRNVNIITDLKENNIGKFYEIADTKDIIYIGKNYRLDKRKNFLKTPTFFRKKVSLYMRR